MLPRRAVGPSEIGQPLDRFLAIFAPGGGTRTAGPRRGGGEPLASPSGAARTGPTMVSNHRYASTADLTDWSWSCERAHIGAGCPDRRGSTIRSSGRAPHLSRASRRGARRLPAARPRTRSPTASALVVDVLIGHALLTLHPGSASGLQLGGHLRARRWVDRSCRAARSPPRSPHRRLTARARPSAPAHPITCSLGVPTPPPRCPLSPVTPSDPPTACCPRSVRR